jgi:CPA2 family monovalent cation:H+ antiporter-2
LTDTGFMANVAGALLAALAGGIVARLLRIPIIIGYLVAGIVVGPHTPGLFADEASIYAVAKLGAALLMFAVGVQLSLKEMAAVRLTALRGGAIQIVGTILLGILVGLALGWRPYESLYLGCALSLSSTTVMMRILEERGETGEGHGAVMMGILVVQDLSLVVMVALLPALAASRAEGAAALGSVAVSVLRAFLVVGVTWVAAFRGVPLILDGVARTGSRELFVLTVVCLCLLAAYGAHEAGISLELGAFLAGLAISESRFSHEVLTQIRPLRDLFASLFFVSIGMLLKPAFLLEHLPAVATVVASILVGKSLISSLAVYACGWHGRTALLAGMGLAQIGEFSFVLAAIGSDKRLISPELTSVILTSALVTLFCAPFMFAAAAPLYGLLNRVPAVSRFLNRRQLPLAASAVHGETGPRVVILGSGRVGRHVSDTLRHIGVPHVVVDYNTKVVEHRRRRGVPAVFGDASSEAASLPRTRNLPL